MSHRPQPPKMLRAQPEERRRVLVRLAGALAAAPAIPVLARKGEAMIGQRREALSLPPPHEKGPLSVEGALSARRSVREFRAGALTLGEAAQLLWAAQGITDTSSWGRRAAPSAGALYPLEVAFVAGEVQDLTPGIYRYLPRDHALRPVLEGDRRVELAAAALGQDWIAHAPCALALAAVYRRTTRKYGTRGDRYVHMEVGHVGQNVYLQARALGLGTTMVGAFRDKAVARLLDFAEDEAPLALLPVGRLL